MVKSIAAIIEPAHSTVLAAVREKFSAVRAADDLIVKTQKRLDAVSKAAELRRLELGKALAAARDLWPSSRAMMGGARGPGGTTWLEWLASEGIAESTAERYLKTAGWTPTLTTPPDHDSQPRESTGAHLRVVPPATASDGDFDPVPQPRAPLPRAGFALKLGDWKLALRGIGTVDALICDPPYGARTHASDATRSDGCDVEGLAPEYKPWTPADVAAFVSHWSPRVRGWMVALTSHDLISAWEAAYLAVDRYGFAPVPCVIRGMSVRLRSDGPSSWAIYAMVARPRNAEYVNWRTLPGAYVGPSQPGAEGGRGKPLWLMKDLVRDYSRDNDLVCDPLAGYGATLIAALDEGRRCIGAELDHGAYDEACRRAAQPRAADTTDTNT